MDMKTARLANVYRLSISDRQVFVLRAARLSRDDLRVGRGARSHREPQPVPNLDWSPTLFCDEVVCH
jgi:hypothetical protein